nr:streptolysin S family TOMM toxin [Streptococcus equi]
MLQFTSNILATSVAEKTQVAPGGCCCCFAVLVVAASQLHGAILP